MMKYFDKSTIDIVVPKLSDLVLRSVNRSDLESLRQWKNQQKQFFFHQEEITANQQEKWFELFEQRPYDIMLIIEYKHQILGSMGVRWHNNQWDVYNVILGIKEFGGRGLMGFAFKEMLGLANALKTGPISLKVLKQNPAVRWYQKNGFKIIESYDSFFLMIFQPK